MRFLDAETEPQHQRWCCTLLLSWTCIILSPPSLIPLCYILSGSWAGDSGWEAPISPALGCGGYGVKWLRQLQCAKLSWWESTDLIFGTIPLSCRDLLCKSCLLFFLSCTGSGKNNLGNTLPLVIVRNCNWCPLREGSGWGDGWVCIG